MLTHGGQHSGAWGPACIKLDSNLTVWAITLTVPKPESEFPQRHPRNFTQSRNSTAETLHTDREREQISGVSGWSFTLIRSLFAHWDLHCFIKMFVGVWCSGDDCNKCGMFNHSDPECSPEDSGLIRFFSPPSDLWPPDGVVTVCDDVVVVCDDAVVVCDDVIMVCDHVVTVRWGDWPYNCDAFLSSDCIVQALTSGP